MALGSRKGRVRQEGLWIPVASIARPSGHPFYERLNALLDEQKFDEHVEQLCRPFYADNIGRPGLAPGIYFRLLLIGYFEGIDSERGIAWRAADSLAIRSFLHFGLDEKTPEHSTISRTRRLLDVETHQAVFQWVVSLLAERGLVKGNKLGIDGTTLEANAALRSIIRRDNGEKYEEFLTRLAHESGIETPSREQLAKLDKNRPKKGSNEEWAHPFDLDARITKMKDGRTHLAHKAEHAVDLETGAIVAVTVQHADLGDTTTMVETLIEAGESLVHAASQTGQDKVNASSPPVVIGDKGYHSNGSLTMLKAAGIRSYLSEPNRGRRKWKGKAMEKAAVYANRRRIQGQRGKALLRLRGEFVERSFAHVYETGGMRRTHLRGSENILKRLLIHVGAFNLGLVLRHLLGKGTPRGFQDSPLSLLDAMAALRFWLVEFPNSIHRELP